MQDCSSPGRSSSDWSNWNAGTTLTGQTKGSVPGDQRGNVPAVIGLLLLVGCRAGGTLTIDGCGDVGVPAL